MGLYDLTLAQTSFFTHVHTRRIKENKRKGGVDYIEETLVITSRMKKDKISKLKIGFKYENLDHLKFKINRIMDG